MARTFAFAVCLLLLSATAFAAGNKSRLTNAQEKKMKDLKDTKLGAIIFGLAELHMMSQGPLDELVEAIEALIEDIDVKIEENDGAYNERSLQNQSEVTRLTGLITDAEVHIANAENILNNILYPLLNNSNKESSTSTTKSTKTTNMLLESPTKEKKPTKPTKKESPNTTKPSPPSTNVSKSSPNSEPETSPSSKPRKSKLPSQESQRPSREVSNPP